MDRLQMISGALLLGAAAALGLFLAAPDGAPDSTVAAAGPAGSDGAAANESGISPAAVGEGDAEQRLADARRRLAEVSAYEPPWPVPAPLGIDCERREPSGIDFIDIRKAEGAKDWTAAIRMMRQEISDQACHNQFLWAELTLYYAHAWRSAEALEVAAYMLDRWPNRVAESLEVQEELVGDSLNALRQLQGFAASPFARRLEELYGEREQRLRAARLRLAAMPAEERPAERYVAQDACPFECCTFREWTVEQEIPLFESPAGEPLGRSLVPGGSVLGLTGEVHLRPRPILAGRSIVGERSYDSEETVEIPAGAVVFQLDDLGEGNAMYWYRGQLFYTQVTQCLVFDEECWGDALEPDSAQPPHDWWVKIRLADGTEAWARDDGFGNMDSCG